ncbi:SCO4225 family membrane protein [Streptomyces griseoflavus]|uniref:SCO4225 family membrane protein n=1 Tax=Streptomyces griseoflavus TaxID=35619 RepID=UPI00199EBB69|nr:hypothetical protein [Streptomyces griseoflavus]GGV19561.1 hypothetical protein GCM10010293_14710 [Streptomyces griseoflavus]
MTSTAEETTAVTGPGRTLPARLRHALTDVAALLYLGLCAALTVWAYVVSAGENEDASLAGVIPLLATAPFSVVLGVLPEHPAMFVLAVAFGALVNAVVIGTCSRALRRGGRAAR